MNIINWLYRKLKEKESTEIKKKLAVTLSSLKCNSDKVYFEGIEQICGEEFIQGTEIKKVTHKCNIFLRRYR